MYGLVLMASGLGNRYNKSLGQKEKTVNKLLLPFQGGALIEKAFSAIPENVFPVVVTRDMRVAHLAIKNKLPFVFHDYPEQADTIRLGLKRLSSLELEGVFLMVADQALLKKESLIKMLALHRQNPDKIIRLSFNEEVGNPVLFPPSQIPPLMSLAPNETGRKVIKSSGLEVLLVEASSEIEMQDVDKFEDYLQISSLSLQ